MDSNFDQAREFVTKAREALRRGDKLGARMLGEQAALSAPDFEDAWLILTASDSDPQDALAYAKKALELDPQSPRARKAVEWAEGRLNQPKVGNEPVAAIRNEAPRGIPVVRESKEAKPIIQPKRNSRVILYAGVFGLLACVVFVFAAWSAFSSPAFASILDNAPAPTQENLWAPVEIAKPSVTSLDAGVPVAQAPATATPNVVADTSTPEPLAPTSIPTNAPAFTATIAPTSEPTAIPSATETPGVLAMDIVADTPTSAYVPPTAGPVAAPPSSGGDSRGGVRWIDVDLTNQMVYAYEGDTIVNSFVVSTGTAYTPTVTGKFKIWIKLKKTNMSGPGYYLADVPYTMYFYKGYGLHGTYWHSNFGTPMSHGCVNLSIPDAEWLFYWASEGTVVNVHY
ncbi:MAG: L,D-transpeptidase family protein [Anaerolineales bacterium]|nr:L,D-transpeptidase family protein [Anaerolineales bacterium]